MKHLKSKAASGFGAGPNMGGTVAHILAREEVKLMVMDGSQPTADNTVELLGVQDDKTFSQLGSALKEEGVIRLVGATVAYYGGLDIIVNVNRAASSIGLQWPTWTLGTGKSPC